MTFDTFFGGRILTRSYDSVNRPTGFELGTGSDPDADHAVTYGYDDAGRLTTVQDPSRTWTYAFVPNTASLLSGVTSGNFAVTYTYEPGRNAITSVENKVGTTTVSAFTYTNTTGGWGASGEIPLQRNPEGEMNGSERVNCYALGQRTARGQSGSAFTAPATEDFGYNAKGEVISSTHSLDPLRDTIYAYDGIGNRNEATFGGITTAYTANALNQYLATTKPPGEGGTANPTYDDDGNVLSDGAGKRLVWDGENRLIEVRDANDDLIATYTYDGQSRRVKKATTSLAPQGVTEEIYLYDGWNRIATYQPSTNNLPLVATATWGRDLSGSLEGAGGVGGLLGITEGANSYRVTYDANGNVSELIDATGNIAAHYEYDPFGNVVVATGSYAASNPWRFSTKPVDAETGYSYYGYRFYNPETGRWVNRDPIEEEGGVNLHAFVGNEPVSWIDYLGGKSMQATMARPPASSGRGTSRPPVPGRPGWTQHPIYGPLPPPAPTPEPPRPPKPGELRHGGEMQAHHCTLSKKIQVTWNQHVPLSKFDALNVLGKVVVQLTNAQRKSIQSEIDAATRFISTTGTYMAPPSLMKAFRSKSNSDNGIDIEVHSGQAF